MNWKRVALGALGLAVLDAVLSRQSAGANLGGWAAAAGGAARRFLSPAVPAFSTSASTSSSSTSSSPTTQLVAQASGAPTGPAGVVPVSL